VYLRFLFILVLSFTLLSACKPQGASVTPDGARQILQLRGFSPDAKGYFEAIRTEDLAAIRTFFQANLDLNMTNEKGDTPLTYAIGYCELKTIKILADKVDLNAHDRNGDTALFLAYKDRRHDVFDFLLERGADVKRARPSQLHVASYGRRR
jgi:ankyrin repeat protein